MSSRESQRDESRRPGFDSAEKSKEIACPHPGFGSSRGYSPQGEDSGYPFAATNARAFHTGRQSPSANKGLILSPYVQSNMSLLDCIEIEPDQPARHAVIWLHGLGADGHDFEAIVPELRLPPELAIRYVFPNAPSIPVTINGGVVMPAWYDILRMDIERELDVDQLLASAAAVRDLIDRQIELGIPSERILIAGFSQGGAVNYEAALSYPKPLAGLLALSTYFATADRTQVSEANQRIPVFVAHGTQDPVVPEILGEKSVEALKARGIEAVYRTYPMEHQVCLEEIQDISSWMRLLFENSAD